MANSNTVQHDYTHWKRNIILFLSSQTISLFGSALVQYAILWYITLNTQSGSVMTIYIICGFLPTFFLAPFAGVWADRFNRRKLIIFSDGFIAITTLILAIIFLNDYKVLWLLFVASAVRAVGSGIQGPAVGAILPQIVPEDKLTKVNGINGSIQALVTLVSPMVSGALLTMVSLEVIFFIDVVTAAFAIVILVFFLKIKSHTKAAQAQTTSYVTDLKLGLKYISKHSFLKSYFAYLAMFFIFAAPPSFLTPLQVARSFGDDVWRLTAIEVAFSVGMMAGGFMMASWGGFQNRIKTMVLSIVIFGICTFGLGIVPVFWIYCLLMAVIGIAMPMMNTPAATLLQEKVEGDYLGRVFGIMNMIATSMMPLGMLIFGPIADVIAIEYLLVGTGILMIIASIFLLRNKVLIEAGNPVVKQVP